MENKKVSYEDLKKVVEGVARQYSKDLVNGKGFKWQKYEDLVQELWLKAYEILGDYPNAPLGFIAKSLYNKAVDDFRSEMKIMSHEYLHNNEDFNDSRAESETISNNLLEAVMTESSRQSGSTSKIKINRLVSEILKTSESYGNDIYKYVVIKLKLNGYLPEEFEPSISVKGLDANEVTDRYDISEDKVILSELLGYKSASTGGPGSFKGKKYNLRLDLLSLLNVENLYPTYYEVTYVEGNTTQSKWVKEINIDRAKIKFENSHKDAVIISIMPE